MLDPAGCRPEGQFEVVWYCCLVTEMGSIGGMSYEMSLAALHFRILQHAGGKLELMAS